jgi:hypothetical protein
MPAEVIKNRISGLGNKHEANELRKMLEAIIDGIRVVTAKLDADGTVTDTNYTAVFDAVVTK